MLYELHVRGATMRHPKVAPALRGTYAGSAPRRCVDHLVGLGVTTVELLPVHEFVDEGLPRRHGAQELLGLQLDRLLRPDRALRRPRRRARQVVAEFKGMVAGAAPSRHSRSSSTSSTTTPPRATSGARRSRFRGLDDTRLLPTWTRRSGFVDTTGCGNSINASSPDRGRPRARLVALLGDRVPRRRLPLRPRPDARRGRTGAFDPRRRSCAACARGPVLRDVKLIASRGTSAGRTATHSASSRRRSGSGTGGSATRCGTSGAAEDGGLASWQRGRRLGGPLRRARAASARVDQLRHLPRRLHAARPRGVRGEAQRGERRRTTRTAPTTTGRGTAAPRGDRRPRDRRAAGSPGTCDAGDAAASAAACRCCSAATSSGAPRAATTTPTARTTRRAGSTGSVSTPRGSHSRAALLALRRAHPALRDVGRRRDAISWLRARRLADGAGRLAGPRRRARVTLRRR